MHLSKNVVYEHLFFDNKYFIIIFKKCIELRGNNIYFNTFFFISSLWWFITESYFNNHKVSIIHFQDINIFSKIIFSYY